MHRNRIGNTPQSFPFRQPILVSFIFIIGIARAININSIRSNENSWDVRSRYNNIYLYHCVLKLVEKGVSKVFVEISINSAKTFNKKKKKKANIRKDYLVSISPFSYCFTTCNNELRCIWYGGVWILFFLFSFLFFLFFTHFWYLNLVIAGGDWWWWLAFSFNSSLRVELRKLVMIRNKRSRTENIIFQRCSVIDDMRDAYSIYLTNLSRLVTLYR